MTTKISPKKYLKKKELFKMPSYGKEFEDKVFEGLAALNRGRENLDFKEGYAILEKAWDELPEPKYYYNESFLIANWILEAAVQAKDVEMMKKWIVHIDGADTERIDTGERDNRKGEVAFECGDLDKAYEYFDTAFKKGGIRIIHEKKYKEFYLARKKELKVKK